MLGHNYAAFCVKMNVGAVKWLINSLENDAVGNSHGFVDKSLYPKNTMSEIGC